MSRRGAASSGGGASSDVALHRMTALRTALSPWAELTAYRQLADWPQGGWMKVNIFYCSFETFVEYLARARMPR